MRSYSDSCKIDNKFEDTIKNDLMSDNKTIILKTKSNTSILSGEHYSENCETWIYG